jgi:hypothetical protein
MLPVIQNELAEYLLDLQRLLSMIIMNTAVYENEIEKPKLI